MSALTVRCDADRYALGETVHGVVSLDQPQARRGRVVLRLWWGAFGADEKHDVRTTAASPELVPTSLLQGAQQWRFSVALPARGVTSAQELGLELAWYVAARVIWEDGGEEALGWQQITVGPSIVPATEVERAQAARSVARADVDRRRSLLSSLVVVGVCLGLMCGVALGFALGQGPPGLRWMGLLLGLGALPVLLWELGRVGAGLARWFSAPPVALAPLAAALLPGETLRVVVPPGRAPMTWRWVLVAEQTVIHRYRVRLTWKETTRQRLSERVAGEGTLPAAGGEIAVPLPPDAPPTVTLATRALRGELRIACGGGRPAVLGVAILGVRPAG